MYIINSVGIAYHQLRKKLYIINAKHCISSSRQNTHLRCDEIQHGYAVLMIYTLTRDDIPSLSAWIKKSDKSKLVGFFVFTTQFSNKIKKINQHKSIFPDQKTSLYHYYMGLRFEYEYHNDLKYL